MEKNCKNILEDILNILLKKKCTKNELSYKLNISEKKIDYYILKLKNIGLTINIENDSYNLYIKNKLLDKNNIKNSNNIVINKLIDSTNNYIYKEYKFLHPGDSCISEFQYNGYGKNNRRWISPFSSGIYLSIYWNFKKNINFLSIYVSIIILKTLNSIGIKNIYIKIPNDLLCKNKKIAGVIIEVIKNTKFSIDVIIGIGINVYNNNIFKNNLYNNYTTIEDFGVYIDRNILIKILLFNIKLYLKIFEIHGFYPFLKIFNYYNYFNNKKILIIINNKKICGINKGIDFNGNLIIYFDKKIYLYNLNYISKIYLL